MRATLEEAGSDMFNHGKVEPRKATVERLQSLLADISIGADLYDILDGILELIEDLQGTKLDG